MHRVSGRSALGTALWLTIAAPAPGQTPVAGRAAAPPPAAATSPAPAPKVLTGKERLGEKWTDEQRVDNCKVPLDKRGTKPRPDACSNVPTD